MELSFQLYLSSLVKARPYVRAYQDKFFAALLWCIERSYSREFCQIGYIYVFGQKKIIFKSGYRSSKSDLKNVLVFRDIANLRLIFISSQLSRLEFIPASGIRSYINCTSLHFTCVCINMNKRIKQKNLAKFPEPVSTGYAQTGPFWMAAFFLDEAIFTWYLHIV